MKWKRLMGLGKMYSCYKCGGSFTADEFDMEHDMCSYCLFPETARSRSVPVSHEFGDVINKTGEAKMLSELEYIPEKQSKQAKEAYRKYKNGKVYRK